MWWGGEAAGWVVVCCGLEPSGGPCRGAGLEGQLALLPDVPPLPPLGHLEKRLQFLRGCYSKSSWDVQSLT